MPRLIFKCPYIRGGSQKAVAHLSNYIRYMATREGAQRIPEQTAQLPATEKQRQMVERLLHDFPLSRGLFEYEDYADSPTRCNASEFITRALEDNYDQAAKKENYIQYIAHRPRAQRTGAHALFTGSNEFLTLAQVAEEIAHHTGSVWLPILSLRREDAARLGYDNTGQWKELLTGCAMEMAQAMKIPWNQFRWYAAFHDESHHPHVHMVCYSADGKSGYLNKEGIAKIKSGLAREIFRNELTEVYQQQTQRRDNLTRQAGEALKELTREMETGTLENPRIEFLLDYLAARLKNTRGRKQYGYLKAPLKSVVDEIVDELARDSRVAQSYDLWYEMREEVLRTYRNDLPERMPLSRQKEFQRIKNIVIQEAVRLGESQERLESSEAENIPGHAESNADDGAGSIPDPALAQHAQEPQDARQARDRADELHRRLLAASVTRLLCCLAELFQEQAVPYQTAGPIRFTDKKLRRRIQEKKIAMGHKPDDHEDMGITLQ